jgi:hypothetical protein
MKVIKLTESDLTNIVKGVIKENDLKNSLIDMIRDEGWQSASELVGGPKNLTRLIFNNNPIDYLYFIDEDSKKVKNDKGYYFFKDGNGMNNLMIYTPKTSTLFINKKMVWEFIALGFSLDYVEIQELIRKWFKETYNKDVSVIRGNSAQTKFWG